MIRNLKDLLRSLASAPAGPKVNLYFEITQHRPNYWNRTFTLRNDVHPRAENCATHADSPAADVNLRNSGHLLRDGRSVGRVLAPQQNLLDPLTLT